ncbi:branched-chain amino acid ABC transporter permease [Thermanaerosceptrum fracticalcis]|uniref:Branched-chain amino acid ABC transporter permease n=1 Tax=Thermanaerosceptrum fracticalcis TaxID=1712410 RepID=A0A7G6E852_THEFR|nr:branched-chain amino acid ABC transporter permease [Thermanaerosceptrum fracticalcis]QNB48256.1 branched-chain amino acid ABC transporter permease [Thermanaerosceptrum fracticalcis]
MQKLLNKRTIFIIIVLGLLYGSIQTVILQGKLNPYYEINLLLIGINIIMAVSLNLINGFTGQFSIGHAGFMAIGAYASSVLTLKLHQPFPLAILAGSIAAAIIGFLIGLPTLRLKGDYLAIATLGFGEIIKVLFVNIEYVGGASGLNGIPHVTTWSWVFFLTVFTVVFIKNFINSTHGRACISIREDEIAAETMGINTTKYKVMAFTIGAFFAGTAGALYAHYFYIIQPNTFNFLKSIDYLVMVVLGGMGSITGSVLAATALTIISALLQRFAEIRMVIYALLLIVIMLFRPQGLMGNKELSLNILERLGRGEKHGSVSSK